MSSVWTLYVRLMIALASLPGPALQNENRVGLVVDYGNGQMETRCVAFVEEDISGYQALLRSGLALEVHEQGGGPAICRVASTGCPADDCFCACAGGDCVYWSYWHQRDGTWEYAAAGAQQSRLSNGDVDGWVWGPGSVTEAPPPPAISFDAICTGEVVAAGATAVTALSTPGPGGTTVPSALPLEPGTQAGSLQNVLPYAGFAALMFLLGVLAWLVRRRAARGREES